MSEFQIRKDNFFVHRNVETQIAPVAIAQGEVLLKMDRFAFTANNITYAVLGEKLRYWQFFPPADNATQAWGIIPVWGFADVVASNVDAVPVGERLFGYFPPAHYAIITPARITPARLFDGATHRASLPSGYNSYARVNAEPGYQRDMDHARMTLWPLHITSFCLWDLLSTNAWYASTQILILSASSKTSLGLGYALSVDASAPRRIALTSARNCAFVDALGLYGQTLCYQDLHHIDQNQASVIVDMSGNVELLAQLHRHLGENMKRCIQVGLTHWDDKAVPEASSKQSQGLETGFIAERSEVFFAPGHIQKRMQDWGPEVFASKSGDFMRGSIEKSQSMFTFTELDGLDGLAAIYLDVCQGRCAPDQALVVRM
jgi:hypothetical protein